MTEPVRLAVIGVGGIGRLHIERIVRSASVRLVAVADVSPDAASAVARYGAPYEADYRQVLAHRPEGVVIALPNGLHSEVGIFFAEAGVHLLVEKPIADTVRSGVALVESARAAGVKLLVGHHRRHNALVPVARTLVRKRLGVMLATNTLLTLRKPDAYYEVSWRTETGAGPLLVNAVHEIDLLRTICGEIDAVQAIGRNVRGFAFDDTIAINLRYASGAVGTLCTTESSPSPWSWEASVPEGMGFPIYGLNHSIFFGTHASMSFPDLQVWHYPDGEAGWHAGLTSERTVVEPNDPYAAQIEHFARVISEEELPLVDGPDALRTLAVAEAVARAARLRREVTTQSVLEPFDGVLRGPGRRGRSSGTAVGPAGDAGVAP